MPSWAATHHGHETVPGCSSVDRRVFTPRKRDHSLQGGHIAGFPLRGEPSVIPKKLFCCLLALAVDGPHSTGILGLAHSCHHGIFERIILVIMVYVKGISYLS
jgi:hypothetical protein